MTLHPDLPHDDTDAAVRGYSDEAAALDDLLDTIADRADRGRRLQVIHVHDAIVRLAEARTDHYAEIEDGLVSICKIGPDGLREKTVRMLDISWGGGAMIADAIDAIDAYLPAQEAAA